MRLASFARWEALLAAALLMEFVIFSVASPYFWDPVTLSDATFNFTERGVIALPLALLIVAGEIDISVAGIVALASTTMGLAAARGVQEPGLIVIGLVTGLAAGLVNGALATAGRVPSIVATIGTMSLYRGIAYALLGDRVLKGYPSSFRILGQGYAVGLFSIELVIFLLFAVVLGALLHFTRWGRSIYAIGANSRVAQRCGIPVCAYRTALFALTGLGSGVAAILLTSRLGSTRPSIAEGWELEIISMVVLGGVSVWGGKGTVLGVVLATTLLGFVNFGLGLLNVPGIVLSIIVGALMLIVVALPKFININATNSEIKNTWSGMHAE